MSGKRLRLTSILAGIAFSVLTLIAWTQQWVTVRLAAGPELSVGGDIAAPALSTLALASLALSGALTVAGPVFRAILGVLQIALGGLVIYSGANVLANPIAAAGPAVTTATGVSGDSSIAALVETSALTPWPVLSVVFGVLLALLGLWVLVTNRRWPVSGRKYQAVRLEDASGDTSTVGDWDALSGGKDPTS